MNLDRAISKRRSTRRFKNKHIKKSDILKIINCARLAPSAKNRQPWKFIIVSENKKMCIAELMETWQHNNPDRVTSVIATANAIREASSLILCFKDSDSEFIRSDTLSIGAAIQNMLLKATSLGIASLFICDATYADKEISELCNTDLEMFAAVALGVSDETPFNKPIKKLEEIITYLQ